MCLYQCKCLITTTHRNRPLWTATLSTISLALHGLRHKLYVCCTNSYPPTHFHSHTHSYVIIAVCTWRPCPWHSLGVHVRAHTRTRQYTNTTSIQMRECNCVCVCVCMHACVCVCMRVCVCVRVYNTGANGEILTFLTHKKTHTRLYTHAHMSIHILWCICMCRSACVCVEVRVYVCHTPVQTGNR